MGTSDSADIEHLIAELEAKWAAASGEGRTPEGVREYTAAAHWAVPLLIAEIRRLRVTRH